MQNGITEPFDINDMDSIKEFIQSIDFFTFTIKNLKTSGIEDTDSISCLLWEIKIFYDFLSYTGVQVSLQIEPGFCEGQSQWQEVDSYIFIHAIVIILSVISLYLGINSVYKMWKNYKMYQQIYIHKQKELRNEKFNKKYTKFQTLQKQGTLSQNAKFEDFLESDSSDSDEEKVEKDEFKIESDSEQIERIFQYDKTFKQLSTSDKMIFFNLWIIIGILGALIQIIGSLQIIVDLTTPYEFEAVQQNVVGIGAGIVWIIMLYYLSFNPNILGFINALEISGSKIFWFTLGVMPFFIAFLFLFESIFWQFKWFDGTHNTIIALFALMNGDSVNVIFSGTSSYGVIGTFFLLVYIILFFTSVQNVFIIIIMEGYDKMVAKQKEKIQEIKQSQQQKKVLINDELNTQDMQLIQNLTQQGQILEKSDGSKEFINQKIQLNQKLLNDQLKFIEEQFDIYINDDTFTFDYDAKSSLKLLAAEQHHEILQSIKLQVKKKIDHFKQLTINLNQSRQQVSKKKKDDQTQLK
ncbi:hypothetical protein PPERSA_07310 [Pseudocohnilembus persalinus]|uniref:Polycystin cation channel PKD1/PKD2 domain-containing protein n=1 Tax=Pseudocohnilembus persalinus TaxID=266149 RepID=A0A0V0R6V1_PSEPJ|nr:hypothetical protein PPERSA_07310 [Pseudocohnilembus persalinus]|eukprot:KRX10225.1 hypothetical protein PPERSA_07310 [Pseudocohnilembus persalinus]